MISCKNCNTTIELKYCPNCGQPAKLKRIDGHYIAHEIEHVLHFDKGILYTIRELLIRPGANIRRFLAEDRSRLVKPVIFIIVTSLVYTIASHYFHIEPLIQHDLSAQSMTAKLYKWTQDYLGYSNIIMGGFIAIWIKLFFRKHSYNYFEILILLCFVMGMGMLIFAIFSVAQGVTHIHLMKIAGYVGVGYCVWAIGQFFGARKVMSYVKAAAAYILGMLTFSALSFIIGTVIDMLIK